MIAGGDRRVGPQNPEGLWTIDWSESCWSWLPCRRAAHTSHMAGYVRVSLTPKPTGLGWLSARGAANHSRCASDLNPTSTRPNHYISRHDRRSTGLWNGHNAAVGPAHLGRRLRGPNGSRQPRPIKSRRLRRDMYAGEGVSLGASRGCSPISASTAVREFRA